MYDYFPNKDSYYYYRISKSRAFHSVGAACTNDRSKNELALILLIGGTHNKQGSKDARVRKVVLLTLNLIKSQKYSGAVLLAALCVKSKIKKLFCHEFLANATLSNWE